MHAGMKRADLPTSLRIFLPGSESAAKLRLRESRNIPGAQNYYAELGTARAATHIRHTAYRTSTTASRNSDPPASGSAHHRPSGRALSSRCDHPALSGDPAGYDALWRTSAPVGWRY